LTTLAALASSAEMRAMLLTVLLAASVHAGEKRYVRVTQALLVPTGITITTNVFTVPTNTVARVEYWNLAKDPNQSAYNSAIATEGPFVSYPESPNTELLNVSPPGNGAPIVGPATIVARYSVGYQSMGWGGAAHTVISLEDFNRVPTPEGTAVQPAGLGARVALESSSDLVNWSEAQPGNYGTNTTHKFFRVKLSLQ